MLYDKAASQARVNAYFYIEALAHELATRVLHEVGLLSFAELSLKKALEGYRNWGAVQKVIFLSPPPFFFSSSIVLHP
jgi:hypothetical protein